MATLLSARATWKLMRSGDPRARIRATRNGQAAIRVHLAAAALNTGVLDALGAAPLSTAELARRIGLPAEAGVDEGVFEAFLRVVAAAGLIDATAGSAWRLSSRGVAVIEDDLVRASYEVFAGFHTGLYREIGPLLSGGPARKDVTEQGALIARVSAAFEPFVLDVLTRTVTERRPRRILDVGCGKGLQLAAMLEAAPDAVGVGIDTDPRVTAIAEQTVADRGLAGRATVRIADVRDLPGELAEGPPVERFDLVLLANVIYYVPLSERVALLRHLRGLLTPGGTLLLVTTVATPHLVSRHFDLLLRAQEGRMELPDVDVLVGQMTEAGLLPDGPRRIAPGNPLVAVAARRRA